MIKKYRVGILTYIMLLVVCLGCGKAKEKIVKKDLQSHIRINTWNTSLVDDYIADKKLAVFFKKNLGDITIDPNINEIVYVSISYKFIKVFPKELLGLTSLQWLNLEGNRLTELPDDIDNLEKLTKLNLSRNHLSRLPGSLGKLKGLYILKLCNNKLTEVPQEIASLVNLKGLDLSHNYITHLPGFLANLKKLQWICLGGNQIITISKKLKRGYKTIFVCEDDRLGNKNNQRVQGFSGIKFFLEQEYHRSIKWVED